MNFQLSSSKISTKIQATMFIKTDMNSLATKQLKVTYFAHALLLQNLHFGYIFPLWPTLVI